MKESVRYAVITGGLTFMVTGIVITSIPVAIGGIAAIGLLAGHECKHGY